MGTGGQAGDSEVTGRILDILCVNRPLPDTLSNAGRVYSAARVRGYPFSYMLEIVQLEQNCRVISTEVYGVEELSECGSPQREFAVGKCDSDGADDLSGLYFVSLPGPASIVHLGQAARPFRICWCRGYGRWQVCKHFDAIADLVSRGEL